MKISCICVTRNRPERLKQAISDYCVQTWKDRELIIVADGRGTDRLWLSGYVKSLDRDDIHLCFPPPYPHYSRLKNIALAMATGDILCLWDDDDRYHPRRLELQLEDMLAKGSDVSYLGEHLVLFEDTGELFWMEWPRGAHTGTMMCRRSVSPRYSEELDPNLGERGRDMDLANALRLRCRVSVARGFGYAYAYVWHGNNMWERNKFYEAAKAGALSASYLKTLPTAAVGEYLPLPAVLTCRDGEKLEVEPG